MRSRRNLTDDRTSEDDRSFLLAYHPFTHKGAWESEIRNAMKAIIHIGMPKTGARSIWTWMYSNHAALEAEGVHTLLSAPVPLLLMASIHVATVEHGIDEKTAWHGWDGKPGARALGFEIDESATKTAVSLQKRIRAEKIKQYYQFLVAKLEKLSDKPGTFIWLDERLYDKKNLISPLDGLIGRFFEDRIYVVYLRDTVDFFASKYSQDLRDCDENFGTMEFSEFLENCAERSGIQNQDRPLENLFAWREVVGEKLNVRLLESEWLIQGDLIVDFSSLLGVGELRKPSIMNESFASEYIEYVRFLNRRFGRSIPDEIRREVLAILREASSGKPKLAASDEQAVSIRKAHGELEEKVRGSFFPDRKYLFSPTKFRGGGVMPLPLTKRRKAMIEAEIIEKLAMDWDPCDIARIRGKI